MARAGFPVVTVTATPEDASLGAFLRYRETLTGRLPWLDVREGTAPESSPFSLTVAMPGAGRISLGFTPDQQLERPFEAVLAEAASGESGLDPATREVLGAFPESLPLELWVARGCPASASAFWTLARFVSEKSGIALSVVDAESVPPADLPEGVASVPVLVVCGRGRFYGEGQPVELARGIVELASERWEPFMVGHMLDRRLRGELLALLRARALSPSALAAQVGSGSLGRRTAAVVSLADLAAADRVLCAQTVPVLQGLLGDPSPQVRGDALFALAEVGDLRAVPSIERFAADPDPDLREGALEALEKIKMRAVWGWGA